MSINIKKLNHDDPVAMRTVWFRTEKSHEATRARMFCELYHAHKYEAEFIRPNPKSAPWHWQVRIRLPNEGEHVPEELRQEQDYVVINVWPHKDKYTIGNTQARYGLQELDLFIRRARSGLTVV